jgi:hypothetical protein
MKKIFSILAAIFLTGCATLNPPPPAPKSPLATGSKVGVLVTLNPEIEHLHIGTTIFNNFSESKKLPWNLKNKTQETFSKSLSKVGFAVVDLETTGIDANTLGQLVIRKDDDWILNPKTQGALNQIQKNMGIDAVVVISSTKTRVRNECSQFGCAETYMNNSGLFTRGVFLSTRYFSVPALDVAVYRLNEPSILSVYDPLRSALASRVKLLNKFPEPKELRNLTDQEFFPIANSIAETINELATATAIVLGDSAKIP